MEATGIYHLSLLNYLQSKGYFVHVANPLVIKKFFDADIRKGKTDRKDALKLSKYGLRYDLDCDSQVAETYGELMMLSREYNQLISMRTKAKVQLSNLIERTFPGLEQILYSNYSALLLEFYKKYPHVDLVLKQGKTKFTKQFIKMAEKKEHRKGQQLAERVYELASQSVLSIPNSISVQIAVECCVNVLSSTQASTDMIISRMFELAKELPEFEMVRALPGVGDTLALRFIPHSRSR